MVEISGAVSGPDVLAGTAVASAPGVPEAAGAADPVVVFESWSAGIGKEACPIKPVEVGGIVLSLVGRVAVGEGKRYVGAPTGCVEVAVREEDVVADNVLLYIVADDEEPGICSISASAHCAGDSRSRKVQEMSKVRKCP